MSDKFLTRAFRRYSQIVPGALYESHVQILVERNISALFPDYFGRMMDPYFRTAGGDVQPDLVLIRRDYKGWMLIEVEIEGHSPQAHILPQLSKMIRARAGESVSKLILEAFEDEHPRGDLEFAVSHRPEVTLVIHGSSKKFEDRLSELGVYALDIQIYSYPPDDYVLEVIDREENYIETGQKCRRSLNLATRYVWSLPKIDNLDLGAESGKIEVRVGAESSFWDIKINRSDYLLRQPTGIQSLDGIDEVFVLRHRNICSLKFVPVGERV